MTSPTFFRRREADASLSPARADNGIRRNAAPRPDRDVASP